MKYKFKSKLWLWNLEKGSWHFLNLPKDISEEIQAITSDLRAGFGSVKVEATIGSSTWNTSIFPDTKSACYILPVKKSVRLNEKIEDGNTVQVEIKLVNF